MAIFFDSCYYADQRIAAQTFFAVKTRERRKSRASGAPNGLKPGRNVGVKIDGLANLLKILNAP